MLSDELIEIECLQAKVSRSTRTASAAAFGTQIDSQFN
jgi:hypothetical protein